jgi:peptidoglycan hydrolase-like protein with peptidoglycan-binding domain
MRQVRRRPVLVVAALLAAGQLALAVPGAQAVARSCSTATPVAQRPALRVGDTGSCVRVAQKELVSVGYSVGAAGVNGSFGASTLRAVKAFQKEFGLGAEGVVDTAMWTRLVAAPTYNRGRGPNRTSRVVLTFDDCPDSASAFTRMVRAARAADVGLVLAPTGACLQKYARKGVDLAAVARENGQYVINHSVSHPDLTRLSFRAARLELRAPGVVTNYGRPPSGATDATVAAAYTAEGMRVWTWTVDTRNWTGKTGSELVAYVVRNSRAGSTVLLHMGWNGFTPTVLRRIEAGLADRDLKLCNAYDGTTPVRLPRSLPCTR